MLLGVLAVAVAVAAALPPFADHFQPQHRPNLSALTASISHQSLNIESTFALPYL